VSRVEHIGRATLYLGRCEDVLPTLGKPDHIITDPPYGEGTHAQHDARSQRASDGSNRKTLGYEALSVDDAVSVAKLLHASSDGWVCWFTNFDLSAPVQKALADCGRTVFPPLPYYHAGRSVRLAGDGPCSWTDWIVVARTKALKTWGTLRGGYIANEGWNDKERMGGKPTRLMRLMVTDYSRAGETVCDPFMGAGTTGVACMLEGRNFIGVEVDPAAFQIACERIDKAQRQLSLFGEAA
jgi:hypothetical protein